VLIFLLLFRNSAIDGAAKGLRLYTRNEDNYNRTKEFKSGNYWTDAAEFVFTTLFASTGIMYVYGSYNRRDKPVILDGFLIVFFNTLYSIISGMALFMLVGYLKSKADPTSEFLDSTLTFAYVVLPTGALGLEGSNFWTIIIYLIM